MQSQKLQQLKKNKFESYEDVVAGFKTIMDQLKPAFASSRPGHLALGSHGTVYEKEVQELEAFLRPLWGLAPYLTQQEDSFMEPISQELLRVQIQRVPIIGVLWKTSTNESWKWLR